MEATIQVTDQDIVKDDPITLVSPQNPVPHETIFLSNIDQAVSFPVETLYFFQGRQSLSTTEISDKVKTALIEILVPYYFLAGRLRFNCETDRLELVCNNSGMFFVSAESRLTIEELGVLCLPNPTFGYFILRHAMYKSLAETPLFTIQVTRFKCGGFSLGVLTNHGILDGKSATEMLQNLASICRNEGLKTPVIHNDRTSLRARTPPTIKFPHKEYIMLPKISSLPTCFTTSYEAAPSKLIWQNHYDHRLFPFDSQTLTLLKKTADVKCSTFDALVAHIWRVRTRAMFDDPDDISTMLFAVDIRSIVSPPLPSGCVGNAVITAYASSRVGDLVDRPLSYAVGLVKEGKERTTEEYVRSVIDWLEVYNGVPATSNGNFYVSAWWKLPFGELDFRFGKAVHGGPVVSGNDEFVLLLSQGRKKNGNEMGGVNVWLSLEPKKMAKFMNYVFDI